MPWTSPSRFTRPTRPCARRLATCASVLGGMTQKEESYTAIYVTTLGGNTFTHVLGFTHIQGTFKEVHKRRVSLR
jgi:hypothetical protein